LDGGEITCTECGKHFPVRGETVRFIEASDLGDDERRFEFIRRLFYASIYDPSTRLMFMLCGGEERARRECLERLEIRPGSRILETGIGTASNIPYLEERAADSRIFGIDISSSMLRLCEKKLNRLGSSTRVFQARAECLPFRDGSFDCVFHIGAINIFEDKKQAIDEMIRVARPGAKIVIADESDKTNRLWDKLLFTRLLGKRDELAPPIDLIPRNMIDIRLDTIWRGFGYCIEFRTPRKKSPGEKSQ
jgi:SAM-dependent methyltransferase